MFKAELFGGRVKLAAERAGIRRALAWSLLQCVQHHVFKRLRNRADELARRSWLFRRMLERNRKRRRTGKRRRAREHLVEYDAQTVNIRSRRQLRAVALL